MAFVSKFAGSIPILGAAQFPLGAAGTWDVLVWVDLPVGFGEQPLLDIRGIEVLSQLVPGTPANQPIQVSWTRLWDRGIRQRLVFRGPAQMGIIRVDNLPVETMDVYCWGDKLA